MELSKVELNQALIVAIDKINLAKVEVSLGKSEYYLTQAKTLARIQLQLLASLHHPALVQEELYTLLSIMCEKIEAAGASIQLTNAVTFVCDLSAAIGNQYNKPQQERAEMVRRHLPK